MSGLAIQFLDQGFHRVLFDAMPMPVFVVDEDTSLLEYNSAAAQLLGQDKGMILRRRSGEVLHCLHATDVPGGCGHAPACADCVVRESVRTAYRGHRITRRWARLELVIEGRPTDVSVRVSCQPISYKGNSFVLLILEGLNETQAAPPDRCDSSRPLGPGAGR
jgi:PAS domain-containing protein